VTQGVGPEFKPHYYKKKKKRKEKEEEERKKGLIYEHGGTHL
jgi:hypothetical protein